jgi:kynurenine formamidase
VRRIAASIGLCVMAACKHAPPPEPRIVDLTHDFGAETIYWPTEEGFVHELGPAGVGDGGYYYEAHRFRAAEHGGTHLDAPRHFHAGAETVDQIALDRLVGPGVRIDVRAACAADRDHAVTLDELTRWEAEHGEIPHGAIVLLDTGFGAHWPDRVAYLGTDARGAPGVAKLHFPGLSAPAARWLVRERGVRAVGLDTASIDPGASASYDAHRVLAAAGVPALENLAAFDALPARGFTVVALPMKIRDGSGAPLRIVALVPQAGSSLEWIR